jgi:hypothetical protein
MSVDMSAATPKDALVIDGMSGEDLLRHLQEHRPTLYYQLINYLPSAKDARSGPSRLPGANSARGPPRLFTRAEVLSLLKIGETTLFWLQRTGKLRAIRIGSRVLFNSAEIERVATHGASLTDAEKKAAKHAQEAPPQSKKSRGRPCKALASEAQP